MAKRVLVFSVAYLPFVGGAELALKAVTDRSDMEFDLITLRLDRALPRKEKMGNVTVHRIGFGKEKPTMEELARFPMYLNKVLFPLLAFFWAVRLHRRRRYDAVWAMMSYAGFPAVFLKALLPSVPFVLTLQEGDSVEHITRRWRIRAVFPLYRMVFARADVISAISHYLADFARAMGAKCPIEVIPNGVDLEKFKVQSAKFKVEELKGKLAMKEGEKVIMTVSRLVEKNAVGDIIAALQHLPRNVKLLIVGTGPLEESLKLKVQSSKLMDKVIFVGEVAPDDVPQYLALADVFVRPSLSEGFGSAFIEAMAVGVPVVATPVGGIVDFLKDGETGLLCNARDPKSVAEKVLRLLKDEQLREHIVKNAQKMVSERYHWDHIAREMRERIFEKVL